LRKDSEILVEKLNFLENSLKEYFSSLTTTPFMLSKSERTSAISNVIEFDKNLIKDAKKYRKYPSRLILGALNELFKENQPCNDICILLQKLEYLKFEMIGIV
jgi:hypothetical protein